MFVGDERIECGFLVGSVCKANKENSITINGDYLRLLKVVGCQSFQEFMDYEKRRKNFGDDKVGSELQTIELYGGETAIIDSKYYDAVSKYKWHKNGSGYAQSYPHEGQWIFMHHLILPPIEGFETDHIDGNTLNNRCSNLRLVTHRQNGQNRHQEKTSKYPGVCRKTRDKKWTAELRYEGKKHHIGQFDTEEEAFTAYRVAVKYLIGQDVVVGDEEFERRERFGKEAVGKEGSPFGSPGEIRATNQMPLLSQSEMGRDRNSEPEGKTVSMSVLQEGCDCKGNTNDRESVGGNLTCKFCGGPAFVEDCRVLYCEKCAKKMGLI